MSEAARVQFDKQAVHYNERWASWSDDVLRKIREIAGVQSDWKVLDIATGTGFTALAFAPEVAEVVGTDISAGMLEQAKARAERGKITNVTWRQASAEAQPFEEATFDLVTCRIAPHHFPDVAGFVAEVARVLKPGGVFVLGDTTVPGDDAEAANWQNTVEKERDPSHGRNLSPEEWQSLVEAAGLRVTEVDTSGGIKIALAAWLETGGCDKERSDRVRRLFATASPAAREHFQVTTDADGETHFVWQRVVLRAEKVA